MPPKKQKAQKMALSDFFAETTGGSWADEMENALPTAPAPRESMGPRRGEPGYLDSMPDRSARTFGGAPPMREDVPIPDVPPFTAFIGNLTFETEEDELRDFFQDLTPTSVRLVKDPQGKPKGFGYVEFAAQAGLKSALERSGANLAGRSIRVNVAEAPSSRRDFAPSAADEATQWRRATPLAPARAEPPRRTFSGASDSGAGGGDRDWSSARGARFTPSRESSGYGRSREQEPAHAHAHSAADDVDQWRSSRPLVQPASPRQNQGGAGGHAGREAPPHRPAGPADTESTWARGTRVPAAPAAEAAPPSRQRLNLLPRSGSAATSGTPSPDSTPASKPNPFGGARPVDSASRERAVAEHAEERRREREAAAAKAKEEADKAKARADAKRQEERERRPARVHPSRLNKDESAGAKSPAADKVEKADKPAPKGKAAADDEGFEAVAPARRAPAANDKPPAPVKAAPTKAGFSFAAAAGALGDEVEKAADKADV